ncbi:MAG: Asp-tRNA(Asn)/Glu-tRNA(Gln) amidotransferase subunit GatC [Candidatus Paceibacterota bacterium]
MIKTEEIEKLAALSRIAMSVEEKESIRKDIDGILDYVAQIKEISAENISSNGEGLIKNVMREDENPNASGECTDALLSEAPAKKGNYVKVKKIL